MTKINSLNWDFFKDKVINVYYSDLNKLDIIYSFVKNIFIYNIDFYINKIITDIFNTKYPIFIVKKKDIYITNDSIQIDFESYYENKIIKIQKDIFINKLLFINGNLAILKLPILVNNEIYHWKNTFHNFNFFYINKYFDYNFDFLKKDIFEIYFENLKYDFSLYEVIPSILNINKKIENKKIGINIKYAKYNFENEIQKFELVYFGDLFIEQNNIDLSIKKNDIEFKTNILTLDSVAINNIMTIGESIKKIKYNLKILKDYSKNLAKIKFTLNNINNNLYFFNELKDIEKVFDIEINYNFSNIVKINVNENKKDKMLPINISSSDIDIFLIDNISNLSIKSKKILNYSNANGTVDVLINYSYKNIYQIETNNEIKYTIKNLCSFEIRDNNKIIEYIKSNFFDLKEFDFYKFKKYFLDVSRLDWFIKLNNVFINTNSINLKYANKILYIEFYIENIDGKALEKCNISLNLDIDKKTVENKSNSKLLLIIILPIVLIFIIAFAFCYKKIKLKNKNHIIK